jgi:hypothetical protein
MSAIFVDTVEESKKICDGILAAAKECGDAPFRVAVDLEGENLCFEGRIAVVTLAVSATRVYIFDVAALGANVFSDGGLKAILEDPKITKLMFDCRMDAGALFWQYDVTPMTVCDLQAPAVQRWVRGNFLIGMRKSFTNLGLFTPGDERVKNSGRKFFAPELGGAYAVWFDRPMEAQLQAYCAVDVKYFFAAFAKLCGTPAEEALAMRVAAARVKNQCADKIPGGGGAARDF